jgi:hypothetical protein
MASSSWGVVNVLDKVFVETTAQVSRLTGPLAARAGLEAWLAGKTIFTSSTVFLEFQRVVIEAHRRVLPALDEVPGSGNGKVRLAEFYNILANSPNIRSGRQAKRVLAVVSSIQSRFGDDPFVSVEDLRAFINGEIRRFRDWRFFTFGYGDDAIDIRAIGGYLDSLQCSVAINGLDPKASNPRAISCNAETRRCAVRSFIGADQGIMAAVADELHTADQKASRAAERVATLPPGKLSGSKAIGQRLCWSLGDVLIALECPPDALLLSSDHHFGMITRVVKRSWLRFNCLTGEVSREEKAPSPV